MHIATVLIGKATEYMHSNRFWKLTAKQLSGEITPEELQELAYLKGEDDLLPYDDALIQSVVALTFQSGETVDSQHLQEKWNALQQKLQPPSIITEAPAKPSIRKQLYKYVAVAASIATIVTVGWQLWKKTPSSLANKPNIFSTRNGSRSKIQMPDGTQVWLNAGSSLQYDNDTYGETTREVKLIGEAYFDVTKDAAHPFVIHTKAMDVKVIGTAFNVRAYPNEKQTETALIRGAIEVSFPGRPAEKLFLKPNEKITVANAAPASIVSQNPSAQTTQDSEPIIVLSTIAYEPVDSAIIETSWVRNKLVFRNKSFEELAQDMERWYNISFRFGDSSLMQRHLTGTFYHETIFEALDLLKMSSPFQYHFDKQSNTVTLFR